MFRKLEVPLLGLVENMAWYELPDGTRDYVFGEGGGRRTAEQHGTDLLGQIPLRTSLRRACDEGLPVVLGEGTTSEAFLEICRQIEAKLPVAT